MNTFYFLTRETRPDYLFYYQVTWNSLLEVLRGERVVVVNCGASEAMLSHIPSGFEIVTATPPVRYPHIWEGIPHLLHLWRNTAGDSEDQIICLDCRDMLFQRNPFDDLQDGLTLLSEGITHRQCSWNQNDQAAVRSHMSPFALEPIDNWPVLCPAMLGGNRRMVRWLALMIWQIGSMLMHGGTDQGALNFIVNQEMLKGDSDVHLSDPNLSDLVMGGHDYRTTRFSMIDGQVICDATGRSYALVHQWDRMPCREDVLAKYVSGRKVTA